MYCRKVVRELDGEDLALMFVKVSLLVHNSRAASNNLVANFGLRHKCLVFIELTYLIICSDLMIET